MYNCSDAFHKAAAEGTEQKALLIFSDCVFTDTDISVEDGIGFRDYFNTSEDLSIGEANSNEITFTLFNDDRLLNGYAFGDFVALLGVQIGEETYVQNGSTYMVTNNATYVGASSPPYLKRNGTALSVQPSFAVQCLIGYDNKVYAFGEDNRYAVYDDRTGGNITSQNPVNTFVRDKSKRWVYHGYFYNKDTRILFCYYAGTRKRYEFVPLGHFTAKRPKTPDRIQIEMTCYDFMQKFDVDMPSASELGVVYPTTIGNLYAKMCDYVGVSYVTNSFANSGAVISAEPDDFASATMRDVLKWIAEAAGCNAHFTRDGVLDLVWLRETEQSYEATHYSDFNPYWYKTKQISKLYNRTTSSGEEQTVGSGSEGYLIQDNPLLKGVN